MNLSRMRPKILVEMKKQYFLQALFASADYVQTLQTDYNNSIHVVIISGLFRSDIGNFSDIISNLSQFSYVKVALLSQRSFAISFAT